MAAILTPGTLAPEFSLSVTPDQKLALRELRGNPVILAFYPADWSPVCGDQLAPLQSSARRVLEGSTRSSSESPSMVCGVIWRTREIASSGSRCSRTSSPRVTSPSGLRGLSERTGGLSERALFVIDRNGVIAWSYVAARGESGR